MENISVFLQKNPYGVLATAEEGTPHTRVFQYLCNDKNKFYFYTGTDKQAYKQLRSNPEASFCVWNSTTFETLSLNGQVTFVNDEALKSRVLEENPSIKTVYETPFNPVFQIFYLEAESAQTFSYAEGTKHLTLEKTFFDWEDQRS